ncbi:MAG: DUF4386 domain-containing protein [Chloroflexi bacterium]|nr:DUF4386 domain-containing protein [Chloroflexota bacterium]
MNTKEKTNPNKTARIAGVLYLLIAVCGGFAFFAGYESLIVSGDATATVNNIINSESIFRIGLAGDALTFLGEIVLTVLLYNLFKPVNRTHSLIAAFSRLAMTAMIGVNMLNKLIALHLLSSADYLAVFALDQLHALANLFLTAYGYGSLIWGIFFGLHLLIIGYLIFKSTYFPKFLGILFLFASFGYLTDSFGNFLLPQYDAFYTAIVLATIPAELAFAFWLLIKGVNIGAWEKRTLDSA